MKKNLYKVLPVLLLALSLNACAKPKGQNTLKPIEKSEVSKDPLLSPVREKAESLPAVNPKIETRNKRRSTNRLFTGKKLSNYDNDVKSAKGEAYTLDEIKNCDFDKELLFNGVHFRIPSKAILTENPDDKAKNPEDRQYSLLFPESENYSIYFTLGKVLEENGNLTLEETKESLIPATEQFIDRFLKASGLSEKDVVGSYANVNDGEVFSTSTFFKKDDTETVVCLVPTANNIAAFTFYGYKTNGALGSLSADLLSTVYRDGEDEPIFAKNFERKLDNATVNAVKEIDAGNFTFKVPEEYSLNYDDEFFKYLDVKDKNEILSQISLRIYGKDKEEEDIPSEERLKYALKIAAVLTNGASAKCRVIYSGDRSFSNAGENIPTASAPVRVYTQSYTHRGILTLADLKDTTPVFFITVPLNDTEQVKTINTLIKNSLTLK